MNQVVEVKAGGTSNLTSVEIAELTGKLHKHVMRDVENMLKALGIDSAEFSAQYKDITGRTHACFSLPPREVKILITGYDVARRAKVIGWLEHL
jgi:phage regulator Rha-like protein